MALLEVFPKEFLPTIECESSFRHYNKDGSLLKSPTNDYGWLQLNIVHKEIADRMGFDFYTMTPAQSVEIAKEVYKKQGLHAWVCSWGKK